MFRRSFALGLSLAALLSLAQDAFAQTPSGDPFLDWHDLAIECSKVDFSDPPNAPDQGGPTRTTRALAIVHVAMYDAFMSIDGSAEPYLAKIPLAAGASKDAAVATAAHATLKSVYPRQGATFDSALTTYLAAVPNGQAKTRGQLIGKLAAQAVLLVRSQDGKRAAELVPYFPSPLPGKHRVDPLNPTQPFLNPGWGLVEPFGVKNVEEFMIPPPPALNSPEYAAAFNEVKSLGEKNSSTRTADQTEIGTYWGYDGTPGLGVPPRLYNQIVRQIAVDRGNTPAQNARLFTLVNIAMADCGIAAWNDKWTYDFWRPILGVREADAGTGPTGLGDGNPNTAGDINWEPLGAPLSNKVGSNFTPPFPAYASGHATFGATTFQTMIRFYGTANIPFTFVSDELNGVTTDHEGHVRPLSPRSFANLNDAIQENADSRIYLGIHWRFDATEGVKQGKAIADRIFNTKLRPTQTKATTTNVQRVTANAKR
jgi:hypothetical protein